MSEEDDERRDSDLDELWDPDLHRRQVAAMTMSERADLMNVLMKQASLVARVVRVR